MGTRQLRISSSLQINEKIRDFLHKKINIVLQDNTSVTGILTELTSTEIVMENMRLKKNRYALSAVAEIYVDSKS